MSITKHYVITPNKVRAERKHFRDATAAYIRARNAFLSRKRQISLRTCDLNDYGGYPDDEANQLFDLASAARDNLELARLRWARIKSLPVKTGAAWSDKGLQYVRKTTKEVTR